MSGRRESAGCVLVSGGASGIGLAVVEAFLAQGWSVSVGDADPELLRALGQRHPGLSAMVVDVADAAGVDRWVDDAAARFGGVAHVVCNAGIAGPTCPADALDPADWVRVLDVNLTGGFLLARAAIPHLRRRGAGSIVFMSSLAGRAGYPNRAAYAASKWGLVGLAKTLAREMGPDGVRVNAVLPGAVAGPRWDRVVAERSAATGLSREEVVAAALLNQSVKSLVTSEEVAGAVLFLCSDGARHISGQTLPIDGDSQSAQ